MILSAIPFPLINPVIFDIWGPFKVSWYGLSYVFGVLLALFYINKVNKNQRVFPEKAMDDLLVYGLLGIVIGGRLGHVLFYDFSKALFNPLFIFKTWEGGMSFHGGLIGAAVGVYLLCRKYKIKYLAACDMVVCIAPVGLFLGRIANFINGELYGRPTDVDWAVLFPAGGFIPRHPSQIYEALLEGVLLFIIMILLSHYTKLRTKPGALCGVFLIGYGLFRSFVEYFREPDQQFNFLLGSITAGQLLSIPMIILGIGLVWRKR
jgi:phosphatidylglycerol:prolipoprotein diacylglycerol transferase